jgi:hypothetical protein
MKVKGDINHNRRSMLREIEKLLAAHERAASFPGCNA